MRALIALVPITLFAVASCGADAPKPSGNDGNATTSNGEPATCTPTCNSPSDCAMSGDPLGDASHFACNSGRCEWLGCKSAAECSASAHGGSFVCQPSAGSPVPTCIPACRTPSDCVPPGSNSSVLETASHFTCNAGACVWKGCTSTSECTAATHTNAVSCEKPEGAPVPTCVPTCTKAADCANPSGGPLYDKTHFACNAGRCEWLGCKSTAECKSALQTTKVVCE